MKLSRYIFARALFTALLLVCLVSYPSEATVVEPRVHAHLTMALCPEYRVGNVSIQINVRIGNTGPVKHAKVISSTINAAANTGQFDIWLPTSYGNTPLNVFAQCVSSTQGNSAPSNVKTVSNCNVLALVDSDGDGLRNNLEDTNCNNQFDTGDYSSPDSFDTDGDDIRDVNELLVGTNPSNPASSPRPFIFSSAPFDPDGDGNSNPVVFRVPTGTWYIRDYQTAGNHLSFPYGLPGDIPITYKPDGFPSDVGAVRVVNGYLFWFLHGPGFKKSDGARETAIIFGLKNDIPIPGPWEKPGITNIAVARFYQNAWHYYVYLSNGTFRSSSWGMPNDIPKVQDYDGDGLFDISVLRPSEQKLYVTLSGSNEIKSYSFGQPTADYSFRGDTTGDGIDEITFWEPATGIFTSMLSNHGFDDAQAAARDPLYFSQLQLGLYNVHLPLSWNFRRGRILYTVIDHQKGLRYWWEKNNETLPLHMVQWGLPGDAQG